jgi:hypothetical protein
LPALSHPSNTTTSFSLTIGDPVLELDQLGLECQQGSKVVPAWKGRRACSAQKVVKFPRKSRLGQLQLLIQGVGQFGFQPILKSRRILWVGHGNPPDVS